MKEIKEFAKTLKGRPVAVFGLARSGLASIKALKTSDVKILAWDDNENSRKAAQDLGAELVTLDQETLKDCVFLLLAPGVPLHFPEPHAVVKAARAAGIEIISDIELFHRLNHGRKTIGITGTNGKSTTTALIGHILNQNNIEAVVGGNIGKAVFDLEMPGKGGVFVFELSSYQIDLCPTFRPDIALLINITPDHIDRHGTMENYAAAKEHMFGGSGIAIIGADDDYSKKILTRVQKAGKRRVIPVSMTKKIPDGVFIKNGRLLDCSGNSCNEIALLDGLPTLRGAHNYQNAAFAWAACQKLGLASEDIFAAMKTFPGLAHRQFLVRTIGNVSFINDSKATNAEAAGKALASYRNIFWIVGGQPKEGGLNGLENLAKNNVSQAFMIGDAAPDFSRWAQENNLKFSQSGTIDVAIKEAYDEARKSGQDAVVLLSPACASFDQFKSYEHRGDEFARIVNELKDKVAA